jgi:hypothetical protein
MAAATEEMDDETAGHVDHLRRFGFTVVRDVMPAAEIEQLRDEVVAAQAAIGHDWQQVGGQGENDVAWDEVWPGWGEQPAGPLAQNLVNWPGSKGGFPQSQLVRLPCFREYLAHPRVMAIARAVLHEHIRLLHLAVPKTLGARSGSSDTTSRGYHSDWPHDLASLVNVSHSEDDRFGDSGSGTAAERREYHHCGAVAQPFPDVTMCLSTIWLLARCGPDSGGT